MVPNKIQYQLLKNLQQSLLSIASEFRQFRSLTVKEQDRTIAQNSGRLEGLSQGLDFFIENFNVEDVQSTAKAFGFQLVSTEDSEPNNVQK